MLIRCDSTHRTISYGKSIYYSNSIRYSCVRSIENLRRITFQCGKTIGTCDTFRVTQTNWTGHHCRVIWISSRRRKSYSFAFFFLSLRYYPVLASLQLRNLVSRLLVCVYIIANVGFTIFREGSCMGFLPLSGKYTAFEEAKLRNVKINDWKSFIKRMNKFPCFRNSALGLLSMVYSKMFLILHFFHILVQNYVFDLRTIRFIDRFEKVRAYGHRQLSN